MGLVTILVKEKRMVDVQRNTIDALMSEHGGAISRGQLRRIVEIYDNDWIVFHELVQNAIDAIQVNDDVEEGAIVVTLDLDQDKVTVKDNGTGFSNDTKLLCPSGGGDEKRLISRSQTKGYQGVGLKAVMYSTDKFFIDSVLTWQFNREACIMCA